MSMIDLVKDEYTAVAPTPTKPEPDTGYTMSHPRFPVLVKPAQNSGTYVGSGTETAMDAIRNAPLGTRIIESGNGG